MNAGIYRHYRGPLYLVLGLAHDANAETLYEGAFADDPNLTHLGEREVVVYVPLMLDGAHLGARMAVRTRADFEAWIRPGTSFTMSPSDVDKCGAKMVREDGLVPRFEYLGERLERPMLP